MSYAIQRIRFVGNRANRKITRYRGDALFIHLNYSNWLDIWFLYFVRKKKTNRTEIAIAEGSDRVVRSTHDLYRTS